MANEFKIKHGFISTGNGEVQGTLDVSTGININAQPVATRAWVTGTALASYATSQDVTDAINALVDSAPGTLNTLNELAAALGDDASFSTTITNSIATKLPLAGGTMSGDIKILYNDHASGAGYDTQLYIGKSDTLGLQGAFPTYVPAGSYGFFSHASSDGVFFGSVPVSAGASNYYATIAWGDDATEYLQFLYKGSQKAYLTTDGHFYIDGSFYSNGAIVATQAWVSAQSFITGYTETDPVFSASAAAGVTTALIDKWNDAFSWGNHADGGYLAASSYTAADILTKIKTVDGAGSGLDADYIDGLTSSQFLRSDTAGILTYNTSTSETLKFANNTSGGLIQLGFQQNDADGMHHRAYLKAYKSAVGSVAGKFDIVIRSVGGGTTNDIFELEASSKAKWRGENLATETFASDEAAAVQDNLDSLVGSLGTAAYTASTAYAPASHTHSYLPLSGGTLTGALTVPRVHLTNSTDNNVGNRITVYESGATSYGMMLWNDNATSGDWATMIYGPNQSNRKISFGKANANFPGTKDSVDELAYIDLDNGNFVATGTLSASGYNASNWDTAYGWGDHASAGYGSAGDTAKGVEAFGWGDHAAAGYLTSESDTLATVTARGNTTSGSINVNGDILLTGTATTTNQGRMIDFTGFDKEGTTDFSDRAYIQHTVNAGGHSGSVLVISSQNDSGDGIAFLTNASSKLKHNSNNIATEPWVTSQNYLTSFTESDPVFAASDAAGITAGMIAKWDDAFSWGNHDGLYALASHTHSYLPLSGGTVTGLLKITGSDGASRLRIEGQTPTIDLYDSDSGADRFYIHVNSNNFYILTDRDGGGTYNTWESPHPLQLEADTNKAYIFGNLVGSAAYASTSDFDAVGAADAVNQRIDNEVIPAIPTDNSQLANGAGYITDGNTNWNNSYGFITASDSITGNAATATKLATARSIALAGDVTGSANFDGSANISITATVANDSHTHDGRYYTESESDARFVNVTGDTVTGNLAVSGASLSVTSTAAGSEAFYVDGVNGRLFTISDDLSDSLFSVNTISGLPVIEAFADNTVKIGPFSNPVTVDSSGVLAIGGVTAATQTYVDNAISGLIGGAPGALDTLNELAAAINDDASYASTITTALGTKAPLASPALTGTPTAPTAAAATNNTQIATTAFVKSQGYLTSLGFNYGTGVTANYVVQRDANGYIYANYINLAISETENPTVNSFIVSNGDGWTRKASVAHIKSTLGLGSAAYTASTDYAAASHTHTFASLTSKPTTLAGYGITDAASSSHNHDSRYMRADTDANTAGAIRINGSYSYGTYTAASNYKTGADNLVLKGNANGVSGIFFESEKDGTNINHPSDFGFIQYSAYGTGTSGESNELIIGVSNDGDDHLVFNAPDVNGLKFRIGASTTDNTVYHSGNLTLATLGYTGATNANYITNNNQLTNGAGYITSFDITTQTDPKYLRSNAADTAGGLITFAAGIDMANTNISGVNHISINDAGWGEGIQWDSWLICESPDDLTNAAGNLQFANTADNGVRVTLNTDGAFYPGKDRLQDFGQPDARWRVVFCETLDSAGLHESNLASDTTGYHATGTVLVWKDGEAVPCTTEADHMKIGVAVFGNSSPLVQGAEPVLVSGEVKEGDYLITSEVVGHAKAVSRSYVIENQLLDCVIGKALETASGESHLVKTWVTI